MSRFRRLRALWPSALVHAWWETFLTMWASIDDALDEKHSAPSWEDGFPDIQPANADGD